MTIEELSARLERVERDNSRLRRWGGLAILGVLCLAVLGQATPDPKIIEAQAFVLKGPTGQLFASLEYDTVVGARLSLRDGSGAETLSATAGLEGIRLSSSHNRSLWLSSSFIALSTNDPKREMSMDLSAEGLKLSERLPGALEKAKEKLREEKQHSGQMLDILAESQSWTSRARVQAERAEWSDEKGRSTTDLNGRYGMLKLTSHEGLKGGLLLSPSGLETTAAWGQGPEWKNSISPFSVSLQSRDTGAVARKADELKQDPEWKDKSEGGIAGAAEFLSWNKVAVLSGVQGRFDIAPHLALSDSSGVTRTVLGVADLVVTKTGATETTAPSSLVLFDKDGKVMERLPR